MTDVDPDLLSLVRDAERQARARRRSRVKQGMSRDERAAYLRSKGWSRLSSTGSQRWGKDGRSATLSGATSIQLAQDNGQDA